MCIARRTEETVLEVSPGEVTQNTLNSPHVGHVVDNTCMHCLQEIC